jgi:hypothetical protein
MWNLGWTQPVIEDPDKARIINEPVRSEDSETEPVAAPEFNEFESDDSPELMGLSKRQQASFYEPSRQYVPAMLDTATENHNVLIDNQVATSGTAAAREAQGIQGHGTTPVTIGIEPEIRPDAQFGNSYFNAGPRLVMDGSGDYMSPPVADKWAQAVAQDIATKQARQAYQGSLYDQFLTGSSD